MKDSARFRGIWEIEVYEKAGGKLLSKSQCHNIITDEGLNHLLNVVLHDTAKKVTWYVLLFEDDFTPDGDETYAVPGYTECEAYTEATRPEFNNAASSAKSTTNSANKAVFTMNDTKTLYGAALVSVNTKGDEAGGGILFSCGRFDAAQPVISGNVVNATYTVTAADDGV